MRRTLQSALGTLPEGPVAVGQTWTIVRQIDAPLGQIAATDTYSYEGPVRVDACVLEKIRVTAQFELLPHAAETAGTPTGVPRQRLEGVYLFDAAAGRLAESRLRQTIESEVPYGDARIRVTTTNTLVARISAG